MEFELLGVDGLDTGMAIWRWSLPFLFSITSVLTSLKLLRSIWRDRFSLVDAAGRLDRIEELMSFPI